MQNDTANHSDRLTQVLNRRHMLGWSGAAITGVACSFGNAPTVSAQEEPSSKPERSRQLVRSHSISQLQTRNKLVLELEGKLFVNEEDKTTNRKKRDADVRAKSTLEYFELTALENGKGCIGAAREYTQADAEHWVSGNASKANLREECKQTVMLKHNHQWQQFCPKEPLAIEEVELTLTPLNSNVVDLLLPEHPAKANEPWKIAASDAKELFNLESASDSTLVARISKVEQGVATIDLAGSVSGTANGVATQIEVKGSFQAKLASRSAIVSWVGLSIHEKRSISQSEPGFDITARIRLLREEQVKELAYSREDLITLAADSKNEMLWMTRMGSVLGRYTFLANRNWKTYIDTGDEAIFRLVMNNAIVCQCNVTRLPSLDPGKQLTLPALQNEIRQSLGSNFQSFLEASEKVTSNKLKLMRVVVSGSREEVPIQWVYAHLSDDKGRRNSMVFTMGATSVEQFAGADEQLCGSFEMHAEQSKSDDKPEVAPKLSEAPKAGSVKK
jgi:hypothetical protein